VNVARQPIVRPRWLDEVPVTQTLLTLNVAVFVVQLVLTAGKSLVNLPPSEALAFGASYSLATVGENRWETLVTACFLHDGALNLLINMLLLWGACPLVERTVGSARLAPMYLVAGVAGNLLSVGVTWLQRTAQITMGASGAIFGVLTAALVLGWRDQGWRSPLTQAMCKWLGFFLAFGVASRLTGGHVDNAAHVGGAVVGAVVAIGWRGARPYSERATRIALGACTAVVVGCIAVVGWRDRTDPYATLILQERDEATKLAVAEGRCRDAHEGLRAVERLRDRLAPVSQLRDRVEGICGHVDRP
jgi:rhomboid protease GluP